MNNAPYDANGDMIAREGQKFRRVGWRINGGENDGIFAHNIEDVQHIPHGSFSPIYVEVED